jgi:hypothetical protein
MDTCWVVEREYPYEDNEILAVCRSEEAAHKFCSTYADKENESNVSRKWRFDRLDKNECWNNGYHYIIIAKWEIED